MVTANPMDPKDLVCPKGQKSRMECMAKRPPGSKSRMRGMADGETPPVSECSSVSVLVLFVGHSRGAEG